MRTKTKTTQLATITHPPERDLLWCSLYLKYGMHSEAFKVTPAGAIYPDPLWWRKRKLLKQSAVVEVRCFITGWMAGRKAEATAVQVHDMWQPVLLEQGVTLAGN